MPHLSVGLQPCRPLLPVLALLLLVLLLPELATALVCPPSFSASPRPITSGRSPTTMTATTTTRPSTTIDEIVDTRTAASPTITTTPAQLPRRRPPLLPLDLASPHVRLDIRPATIDELSLIVDMRLQVFGQQKKGLLLSPSTLFSSSSSPTCSTAAAAAVATAAATAAMAEEWKMLSMQNLLARRAKGAIVFIATARDVRRPEATPVLVGSVEASTHEFAEVGFSPCLSEARAREEEEGNEDEDGEVGNDGYCFYSRVSSSSSGRASSSLPSSSSSASQNKKKGSKLYITGMMVSEAFRRQGVAASLLRAIDTHASQNQINYICLYVEGSNESALKLYERNGYHLVAFSPQAESFASAIGLYKGPFSARQYSFAYKRLRVGVAAATGAGGAGGGEKEEGKMEKENVAWPGRVLQQQQQQQQQQQRQNPLTLTAPTWWFASKGGEEGGEGKEQQQQQQQEKSLLSEPSKPFPARSPSLLSPF